MKWVRVAVFIVLAASSSDASNVQRAERIHRLLMREHSKVTVRDITQVLNEVDRNLSQVFPQGPFTKEDFISLAMTESRFNGKCVGSSGERGVFQVMPGYHHRGDLASVKVNTRLAFLILKAKYREHHDRRKAIIAYNGYVVHNGVLRDVYWIAFLRQKARISA